MNIPGVDLLDLTATVIEFQTVQWYQYTGRSRNAVKQYENTYNSPVTIQGSFQPVPRRLYEEYRLDFSKEYFYLFTSNNLLDVGRDVSSDYITSNSARYDCQSATPWYAMDGWTQVLCVAVAPT